MSSPNPTIEINPQPPHAHTHTIIFLHGRGDTASNFYRSLPFSRTSDNLTIQESLPSTVRWVFPSATPHPCVTQNGQRVSQWFDVANVRDFSVREELQLEGLRPSVDRIRGIIRQEVMRLGGRADRVVLMGISQGAAVGVHTLLNLDLEPVPEGEWKSKRCLGAFLGFSCRMPFPGRALDVTRQMLRLDDVPESNELVRNTPILLEHCVDDPLVLIEHGRNLLRTLQGFEAQVIWKEYANGGHWFHSPNGMDDAVNVLIEYVFRAKGVELSDLPANRLATSNAMDMD